MTTKEISTGSILYDKRGRMIFALQRKSRWFEKGNKTYAFFTGIGGRLEQDETFPECFIREAKEEMKVTPRLVIPQTPLIFINNHNDLYQRALTPEEKRLIGATPPLAIWEMKISQPESGQSAECLVPIYLAQLPETRVQASDDIPAIIAIGLRQLQDYSEGINIETLRQLGGLLSIASENSPPDHLVVLPFAEPLLILKQDRFANLVKANIPAQTG